MHTKGSITGRHLAIAVLVLVVVNAQLTWWIVFTTGQARDRLELERALLDQVAKTWAARASGAAPGNEPPLPDGLEVVETGMTDGTLPAIELDGARRGWVIRPTREAWDGKLDEYRRRIVMMASEGGFFAVLLMVLVGLLWRTVRREVELERRHRNFLSAITHELQSPIAAIRVALETVVKGRADEAMSKRFVTNALADTDRLGRLVQKVLQATRYDQVAMLQLQRVCLSHVVDGAVATFEPGARAARAEVVTEVADDLWAMIDEEAMSIVLSNLLENALKYGRDPVEIRVGLRIEGDEAVLEVSDNGDGIPEEEIPFVFDRFYRAGDEMTRTSQGTGLGLYLVQRIVKAHHGTVAVADTGGGGTTFCITLPEIGVGEERA